MILICVNPNWCDYADVAMAFLALIALMLSVCEYRQYKKRERVNILAKYNDRYATDSDIRAVVSYLEKLEDGKDHTPMPDVHQLEMYMRFCEELFFLIKSSSMKRNIVYYMFGHYVLVFNTENEKWFKLLGYNEKYWTVFRKLVCEMNKAKKDLIDRDVADIGFYGEVHDIDLKKLKI